MIKTAYQNALGELSVAKLGAFLKANEGIVEVTDWSKMKAGEKRASMLEALELSPVLRDNFVNFYDGAVGNAAPFKEWEVADLPSDGDVEQPDQDSEASPMPGAGLGLKTNLPAASGAIPTFVDGAFDQIVSDVAGMNAQDSDTNLKEMEDKLEFEHIRMGVLLSHIQKNQHYETLGFANMREYLAAHTGLHYRKAMFLVSNADIIQELDIPAEDLKGVSWSALRHVVPVLKADNYKHWLEAARSLTHVSLIEEVRTEKAKAAGALASPSGDDDEKPKPSVKTFNFYPEQKASVEAAIDKAKVEGNVDSPAAALDLIAASYTGKPPSDTTVAGVMPDLSDDGFKKMLSKVNADEGVEGAVRLLNLISAEWPEIEINVSLPTAE